METIGHPQYMHQVWNSQKIFNVPLGAHVKGVKIAVQNPSISNTTAIVSRFSAVSTVVPNS